MLHMHYLCNMRFRLYHLDVEYKGAFIPIKLIKEKIDQESLDSKKYELMGLRSYDKETNRVVKKFAWDAVLDDMINDGSLEPILKQIIRESR